MPPLDYEPAPLPPTLEPDEHKASPWTWVPALYFMQTVPNALATATFPIAFKSLGLTNIQITAWTPILSLPWTLKLLWAPLVDVTLPKRTWVLAMQALILAFALLAALGMSLPSPFYPVLGVLLLMTFCSATHDIAADGLYLLSLSKKRQAQFVGVLTTSARLALLLCQGGLVWLAGYLNEHGGFTLQRAWTVVLCAMAATYGVGLLLDTLFLPSPAQPASAPGRPRHLRADLTRTAAVVATGLTLYLVIASAARLLGHRLTTNWHVGDWAQPPASLATWTRLGIAAGVALPFFLVASVRTVRGTRIGTALTTYFAQPNFGKILFFIATYRLGEATLGNMPAFFFQDTPANGGLGLKTSDIGAITGFGGTLGIILGGLIGGAFVARLGLRRAFWPLALAMHAPNLLFLYAAVSRPPVWQLYAITFTDKFGYGFGFAGYFVYLMHVAQRSGDGAYRTTHYAIGTGLGAITILLATALSGILQSALGYPLFFASVCLLTLPGMLSLFLIPFDTPARMDPQAPAH